GDAEGPPEHLQEIGVGEDLMPVFQDEYRLDALVLAPVMERQQHGHDQRHDDDGGEQQQRGSAEKIGRRLHVAAHAKCTASPSPGIASPVFWRITVTTPSTVSI